MRIGVDEEAEDGGVWMGVWVKAENEATETWAGSLWFPHGRIAPICYTTLEIYGRSPIAPTSVPHWLVTMDPPAFAGTPGIMRRWGYHGLQVGEYLNSLITVRGDTVRLEVGLDYVPAERR